MVRVYSSFVGRALRRVHRYTYAEYLAHEAASSGRHEFLDGEIYALVNGSPVHAALSRNVVAALVSFLGDGPYVVRGADVHIADLHDADLRGADARGADARGADLKIRALASGLTACPDAIVIRGPVEADALCDHVALNPVVLVEVTSPGTEDWDRGEKLDSYRQIPSLRECVIVSHRACAIDVHRRAPDGGWTVQSAGAGGRVSLPSLGCELRVDDVYQDADVGA
jgi:Uma2 family endonuclease